MSSKIGRRKFVFNSMQAASLLSPVFSMRSLSAQQQQQMRSVFFIEGGSYPTKESFFPTESGNSFNLSPILQDFGGLKSDMVIVEGINIRDSGPKPRGNNHVRAMGKVLTAMDIIEIPGQDGLPGGPSIDQIIANTWNSQSIQLQVNIGKDNNDLQKLRDMPFALGKESPISPIKSPVNAWDILFKDFTPTPQSNPEAQNERRKMLLAKKSVLDSLVGDLTKVRQELSGSDEVLKLDMYEDSIRSLELSISSEIEQTQTPVKTNASCSITNREDGASNPQISKLMFDLLYTSLICGRRRVASILMGRSSQKWLYEWLDVSVSNNSHDDIYHRSSRANDHIKISRWGWGELAKFVTKLKQTPDINGNMLDNTLIFGASQFGNHHQLENIPCVLIGNAQGRLKTGRFIKVNGQSNAKVLTSVANLCNVNINGLGDEPNSGPLSELG